MLAFLFENFALKIQSKYFGLVHGLTSFGSFSYEYVVFGITSNSTTKDNESLNINLIVLVGRKDTFINLGTRINIILSL